VGSSAHWRPRSPSSNEEWVSEEEKEEQRVVGQEDFVADDDAERRTLVLRSRLPEKAAEAEQEREEKEARAAVMLMHEYKVWHMESATRSVK
jgi:hypothetical protein